MDKATITLVGAVIGGATGVYNLWKSWLEGRDRLFVGFGPLRPVMEPGNALYVINLGKHPVELQDYGFVLMDGRLMSLPWFWETLQPGDDEPHSFFRGDLTIDPRGKFEAGLEYRCRIAGTWAESATGARPVLTLNRDIALWRRAWIRARWWFARSYC
jgi:hypothetical protein